MLPGNNPFIMTYRIWKERKNMGKQYVRNIQNPLRCFQLSLYVEDSAYPLTRVYLREMGSKEFFDVTLEHLSKYYKPCSPYEAIASMPA